MSEVYLENITKVFPKPRTVAVDGVTLSFDRGKTSCLLGPSGCGKTTTLRIIGGLISPTKGDVYFDGEKVTKLPPHKRNVGMVFQFAVVYDSMKIYDNLAIPLKSLNHAKSEIDKSVKEIATMLGLAEILDDYPFKFDVGIRQRISLARALIKKPKLLLLDEPLTNLDPLSRIRLRFELKRLQREWSQTIIYVTHDQSEALTLGDKIAIMNLGRVVQYDTPDNIYDKPSQTFCASFVGNPPMNLIEASIERTDGKLYLIIDSERLDISKLTSVLEKRSKVMVGIRPEHIEVFEKAREGAFKRKINVVELLGNNILLNFELGGKNIKAKTSTRLELREGGEAWFHFKDDKLRFFDPITNTLLT